MVREKLVTWLTNSPKGSVLFIFSLVLVVFGVYILNPFFSSTALPDSLFDILKNQAGELVIGAAFIGLAAPGLVANFIKNPARKFRLEKTASFCLFLGFLFLAIFRLLVFGVFPLFWIYPFSISLAMGIYRLWYGVRTG